MKKNGPNVSNLKQTTAVSPKKRPQFKNGEDVPWLENSMVGKKRKVEEERIEAVEEVKVVELLSKDHTKAVRIGTDLDADLDNAIVKFLNDQIDALAWDVLDMKGIDLSVIVHKLNVNPDAQPMMQKKRAFEVERNKIIKEEVGKLAKPGYIKQVNYPEWLANVVLVPKSKGKGRTCIDITNLNRVCPKDL